MTEDGCIFCKIVRGEIPCAKLFETEDVLAFLDISPVNPGHALVIPKAHSSTVLDLPAASATALLTGMQRTARALMAATKADGFNLNLNAYEAAGQVVMHAHWHIIPRFHGDGLSLWPQGSYESIEAMERMAASIREYITI